MRGADFGCDWKVGVDETSSGVMRPCTNTIGVVHAQLNLGRHDKVNVLSGLRCSELFAAYANGDRLYDVGGSRFDLARMEPTDVGPPCLAIPVVHADRWATETHDDQIRWKATWHGTRGRVERLWSVVSASTYRYLIEYAFREDGSISCRLGATGHNAFVRLLDVGDAHLHVACWRIEFDLGDPGANEVQKAELRQRGEAGAELISEEFNCGMEGGDRWRPGCFTRLRLLNRTAEDIGRPLVGYDIIPHQYGRARSFGQDEDFLENDFWVSRAVPENSGRWWPEVRYRDLPRFVAHRESLRGHAPVVWLNTPLTHVPRGEDFGRVGYPNHEGVAHTMWTGFTMQPLWRAA
jgi:Cu2+-containing amine oxidase